MVFPYKPTTARWKGKTYTIYIVYKETHLHNYRGKRRKRTQTRVKRVYVSGKLLKVSRPGVYKTKTGKRVYGIKITYLNPIPGGAGRGHAIKKAKVTKIVRLPRRAKQVKVFKSPEKIRGPLMDIT
jgi:hypothetical protein